METFSFRPKMPVEWVGFFNSTGYGQSAVSSVFALDSSGKYDIRIKGLHGLPAKNAFNSYDFERLSSFTNKEDDKNSIQILHSIPEMHSRVRLKNKRIALATFETFQPPEHWAEILNRCDAVFCPSSFNKEQFERAKVKRPIFVIPHVLDFGIWNPEVKPICKNDRFTFLFMGTWRHRKGWDALIEAWIQEFNPDESVRLVIKTDKTDKAIEDVQNVRKNLSKKEIAPISFERRIFHEQQMASFMRSADCYISPTLGEGFGLPSLQAMALKVPVIVTNFSGCQEYAKEDNCTLLEPSGFLVHESIDPIPQFSYKKWPRIKVSTIQTAMRSVYQEYKKAQEKADKAHKFVQENFNYNVFISKFDAMTETVYRGSNSQTKTIQRNTRRN